MMTLLDRTRGVARAPRAAIFSLVAILAAGAAAQNQPEIIQAPEGGRLDAIDAEGNIIGPCPLKHTDVAVDIAGHFTRVSLRQTYQNPYDYKIEAVYTFPMSHRAAVDRMRMIVGERIVEGEVKEREEARQIYEAARAQGYVASLLEQERPNIFTQSVANIEPGREVIVEISYVEVLEAKDGEYSFDFPMVVGPRYIPGSPTVSPALVPAELEVRRGVILLGPAKLEVGESGGAEVMKELGSLQTGKLHALLTAAQPIKQPGAEWYKPEARSDEPEARSDEPEARSDERSEEDRDRTKEETHGQNARATDDDAPATLPQLWYTFSAEYCDGSKEFGELFSDGTGHLNSRWFFTDPAKIKGMGTGFAQDTDQVPDASNITPEPVKPGERAGHDISITVKIDTGGPKIAQLKSISHDITLSDAGPDDQREEGPGANVLHHFDSKVSLALTDKKAIPNNDFVLSWSLDEGDSIAEAIFAHTARDDKGNFLTLILNPPARIDEEIIRDREIIFVMDTSGSMRGYPIEKSKEVMRRIFDAMRPDDTFNLITFAGHTQILWDEPKFATRATRDEALRLVDDQRGSGGTEMMTAINAALFQTVRQTDAEVEPMRIVIFLTDGYVGNDMAIIDAIEKNRGTTRIFSFGIGDAVNRYLIDGMADAGRGESEVVLLAADADEAVARLTKRVQTPVLTDISFEFSDQLDVTDVLPGAKRGQIPDLFDAKPLVIHAKYDKPGAGTLTIRGRTAKGDYERTIELDLPAREPEHDVVSTLWARAKIDQLMQGHLDRIQRGTPAVEIKDQIIALGVNYQIMSQFTSFVAVEKSRITLGGAPVLVPVPIEMPAGVSYEGVFGESGQVVVDEKGDLVLGLKPQVPHSAEMMDELAVAADAEISLARRAVPASRPAARGVRANAGRGPGQPLAGPGGPPARMRVKTSAGGSPLPGGGGGGFGGGRAERLSRAADRDTLTFAWQAERGEDDPAAVISELARRIRGDADQLNRADAERFLELLFGPIEQKLLAERLSITIADLAESGETEAAETLARALAIVHPKHATVERMTKIFDDESLTDETRAVRLREIADASRASIERAIASDLLKATMRHRLAEPLVPFAEGEGFPETLVQIYDGPTPAGATWRDGGVLLNVLIDDVTEARLDAIEALGAKIIERIDASSYVIAAVPLGRIDDIALLDGVRRVDITRLEAVN